MSLSESQKWIRKAKDAIEDAKILFDYGKKSGPITKIYYSAFYCAKALLISKNVYCRGHASSINAFGKRIVIEDNFPRKYGRFLNKMYDLRSQADYSTSIVGFTRKKLNNKIRLAGRFIEKAEKILRLN